MLNVQETLSKVPTVLSTSVNLKHMIIKFRWMGMDVEAEKLHQLLDHIAPGESTLLWPQDTD